MMMKMKLFTVAVFFLVIELSSALTFEERCVADSKADVQAGFEVTYVKQVPLSQKMLDRVTTYVRAHDVYKTRIIDNIAKMAGTESKDLAALFQKDKDGSEKFIFRNYAVTTIAANFKINYNDYRAPPYHAIVQTAIQPFVANPSDEAKKWACWLQFKPKLVYGIENTFSAQYPIFDKAFTDDEAKIEGNIVEIEGIFKKCTNPKWPCIKNFVSES
jgi:hypothetical protein